MKDVKNEFEDIKEAIKKIDIYKIYAYFLVCAFIGWLFETLVVWITLGKMVERGYLFLLYPLKDYFSFLSQIPAIGDIPFVFGLPIIEIYGFGGLIMILCFRKSKNHPIKIFFYGMLLMTIFELLASYFCTGILGFSAWDYSEAFMNFQGRICLKSAVAWGFLSVFAVEVLMPQINKFYELEQSKKNFKKVVVFFIVYAIICAAIKYVIDPSINPN